jgi:hypothetical protein
VQRYIADNNGGTCGNIIDFSGEPRPERGPLTAITLPPGGALLVGHVRERDRHDDAVPIPVTVHDYPEFEVNAKCTGCPARSELSSDGPDVLLLIVHADWCPVIGELLAMAGVS